jgi:tellurite resistance protein
MSAMVANIHQMLGLIKNDEVLKAIDTLLRACVPIINIDDELTQEEQQMLLEARKSEYEPL